MSDPHQHDLASDRTSSKWIRGNGLRATLLRSHLTIALLGVGLLLTALATVLRTQSAGVRLAELDGPLAQASTRTLAGLQHSLAGLRGWMALGEESFRQGRNQAWTDEIEPSLEQLARLTRTTGESDEIQHVRRVQKLLQELKDVQWWIEDVAQTPGNVPARVVVIKKVQPLGDKIDLANTALIELEKRQNSGVQRKSLLGRMADLRFAFASCRTTLLELVAEGGTASTLRLYGHLEIVSNCIDRIAEAPNLLSPNQQDILAWIRSEFAAYQMYCDEIISTPLLEWNIARNLLATRAAPIATEVTRLLENLAKNHLHRMESTSAQLVTSTNVGVAMLLLMLTGMAATATLLSIRGARRITQPIKALAQATRDLAAGRLNQDISVTTDDELGRLTISFNEMWGTLREKERALRENEARTQAIVNTAADGIIAINDQGIIESFNDAAARIFGYSARESVGNNLGILMPSPHREEHDNYLDTYIKTGVGRVVGKQNEVVGQRKDGSTFPMDLSVNASVVGERRMFTGIVRDITERKKAEEDLRRFRAAIDTSADGIFLIDRQTMQFVDASASACASVGYTYDEILTMGPEKIKPGYTKEQLAAKIELLTQNRTTVGIIETEHRRKDGSCFPVEVSYRFLERGGEQIVIAVARDVSERKWAEHQLDELHKKMVAASRQAGMAEIATGVLHNVGNVLNSVNVSATVVADKLRKSKVPSLAKAVGLMREHAHDLGPYMTEDEKGRKLPAFLDKLAEHLATKQGFMMGELKELTKNIEHIKKIVSAQQSHAGVYGVVETVSITEVLEDALTVNVASCDRHGIETICEFADLPPISLDKQKLLQIMVNLIRNAKHAMIDGGCQDKRLTLRASRHADTTVRIEVIDHGMGIAAENLTKIFSHGFTTKDDGHGFGLHSAALAAKEMNGSLGVHSDGPGEGATFTLDLPLESVRTEVTV